MSHKLTDFDVRRTLARRLSRLPFFRFLPRTETLAAAAGVGVALLVAGAAVAEGYHSNPWLLSWIPVPCCVTNDCCWQITENEVRPIDGQRWEILATGQIQPRTGWSPDGNFYRCACDFAEGHWIKHQGAHTRCLFVPLRSASR
ncbi:MAG: hypothetical protein IT539_02395 [Bradyrhizobiaceae bacterium]|nr:hypothetical protein [Bradyrhizobiaceae bacterium]